MSYTFTQASSQYLQKVNPTGLVVLDDWSFLIWFSVGTLNTSDGNVILRVGPQGTTSRGFIIRVTAARNINYFDGHTNIHGSSTLADGGALQRLLVTRNGSTGFVQLCLNGVQENSDYSGTPPSEITTGDVFQLSDNDTNGYHYWDGQMAWAAWLQGVRLTTQAGDDYLNQTNGKTICSLKADYGATGSISANKLKELLSLGTISPFTDLSPAGNSVTATNSPTNSAQPAGLPETCSAGMVAGWLMPHA